MLPSAALVQEILPQAHKRTPTALGFLCKTVHINDIKSAENQRENYKRLFKLISRLRLFYSHLHGDEIERVKGGIGDPYLMGKTGS